MPRWEMISTLLEGTESMRCAKEKYLPRYDNESVRNYQNRLDRATLLNMTEQTLDTLAGKPFREEMQLGDDVPTAIVDLAEDIDKQGTNLQAFCLAWFRDAWAKGFSHVLVDHDIAPSLVDEQGAPVLRTLADDRTDDLRPYWVHIRPECVIAAYGEMVAGREVLSHVRILEQTVERNGWGEAVRTRVRVLEPGLWQLWMPVDKEMKEWVVESEGATDLDFVPLVTFYAGKRVALMDAKPPLLDLAYLNVAHWQSTSDQRNVLTVARFPILAASGLSADQKVTIGPNNFLTTENADGKWYYVEHTGAAIKSGQVDLQSLEDQMASYGAEYLRKKPGDETATAAALDSAEATSYLESTVKGFKDCVELAMQYTADWLKLGEDEGGSVEIKMESEIQDADAPELDTLNKARVAKDISRVAYLQELKRRGILSEDYDIEDDQDILDNEAKDAMDMFAQGQGTGIVPAVPGAPPVPGDPAVPPKKKPDPKAAVE
jgi:hypothetical protein